MDWALQRCGWILEFVIRAADTVGLKALPRSWGLERSFGRLGRYRRHSKARETLTDSSEGDKVPLEPRRHLSH